ncbi:N-acetylglucosamine-6-phosphate deacetylase [Pelosinus sp. sgz500959]|uniref:N-acetylglucosamine-6-phosphate deacetylase n=1 Tax=Pelosinus sp. sgz500959 TaxID=3242472 RepID=UPI00366F9FFE
MKAIFNGKIITEQEILTDHTVIFDETIIAILPDTELSQYECSEKFDAEGRYVSPGFIDLHVHGCSGFDTMDNEENALEIIRDSVLKTGVTAFLPTTMTMTLSKITQTLKRIRHAMGEMKGAEVLGCHLEGPFINEVYKGAQDQRHIIMLDFEKIQTYSDVIKIITLAPEIATDDSFIRTCVEKGIVVSIGHSNATYEQMMSAISAGVSHMTHTFNALPPLNHRQPGAIAAAMESDRVVCELIVDNIHVHPAMQRLLLRNKGLDKMILITDAMRASMLGDGQYDLGGQLVTVSKNEARLADGVIAGSVLSLNQAVKNFMNNTDLDLIDAIRLVTINPARQIGIANTKGSIKLGKHADFAIFDESLEIFATLVRGNLLYRRT